MTLDDLWAPPVPTQWEALPARKHELDKPTADSGDNRKPLVRGMVSTLSGDFTYRTVGSGVPRFF